MQSIVGANICNEDDHFFVKELRGGEEKGALTGLVDRVNCCVCGIVIVFFEFDFSSHNFIFEGIKKDEKKMRGDVHTS